MPSTRHLQACFFAKRGTLAIAHPQWGEIAQWSLPLARLSEVAPLFLEQPDQWLPCATAQYESLNPRVASLQERDTGLVRLPDSLTFAEQATLLSLYRQAMPFQFTGAPWANVILSTTPQRYLCLQEAAYGATGRLEITPYLPALLTQLTHHGEPAL